LFAADCFDEQVAGKLRGGNSVKRAVIPLIVLLLCAAGLTVRHAPIAWPVPDIIRPAVTAAVIVEETSQRTTLPKEVIIVLSLAPKYGVKVVDQDVKEQDKVDKQGRLIEKGGTPKTLIPFFAAAKGKPLPELVTRRGSSQYEAQPCPTSVEKLQEAIK
jgi:hypothetical protein